MSRIALRATQPLKGLVSVPGDKSISHRAVIIGSLAQGRTRIDNFLPGNDCLATVNIMRQLGVNIEQSNNDRQLIVHGQGLHSLKEPVTVLDAHNSGTTMRLLAGVLAGQPFYTALTGDDSLRSRPMARITTPLKDMGAKIWGREQGRLAPLSIKGRTPLATLHHYPKVASAQVKSCVILAGLYAEGAVSVTEPGISRDHTERMLAYFGADVKTEGRTTTIEPNPSLTAKEIVVPGDFSSCAYLIAASLLIAGSNVTITGVGLNKTRTGLLAVLQSMGANIIITNQVTKCGEEIGDLHIQHSELKGVTVEPELIPRMIDEIPILAVLACFAEGTTTIKGVAELRHKESDRLAAMANELQKAGFAVEEGEDYLSIQGESKSNVTKPIVFEHYHDHRMAMSLAILAAAIEDECILSDMSVCNVSFPGFLVALQNLGVEIIDYE